MKKILLSIGLCAASIATVNAQRVTVAPEIGLNLSDLSTMYNGRSDNNDLKPGLKIGGVLDIGITRHFSIQPGLFYSMKGAQQDYSSYSSNNTSSSNQETQFRYRIDYLEMPLNFQVKFGHRRFGQYFIGAGPYLGYALGGKATQVNGSTTAFNNGTVTNHDRSSSYSLNVGNDANNDDVTRWDAGLNFNMGYVFRGGAFIRANYGLGLVNVLPGGDDNNYMRNWGFGLSIGYMLP